jgi:hypothetical protein
MSIHTTKHDCEFLQKQFTAPQIILQTPSYDFTLSFSIFQESIFQDTSLLKYCMNFLFPYWKIYLQPIPILIWLLWQY